MLIDSFYMNGTGGDINLIFRSAGQVVTTDDDSYYWTEQEDVFIVQWEGKTSYCSG